MSTQPSSSLARIARDALDPAPWGVSVALLVAVVFLLDLVTELGVAGGVPYVAPVAASARLRWRPAPLAVAAFCTLLTVIGLLLAPSGGELWKVMLNRLYAGFAIWVVGLYAYQRGIAEEKLGQTADEVLDVLESTRDAIVLASSGGAIARVNPAAARMFGWTESELVGQRLDVLLPALAGEAGTSSAPSGVEVDQLAAELPDHAVESVGRARDGRSFPVEVLLAESRHRQSPSVIAAIRDITERKQAEAERDELAEERRRLMQRLLHAYEEERRRIAAQIHDGPAQMLVGVDMTLQALASARRPTQAEDAALDDAHTAMSEALSEMRRIISGLRPALLDDLGLVEALRSIGRESIADGGPLCEVYSDLGDIRLRPNVEIALFRIGQEAITNAVRHSDTSRIVCRLEVSTDDIALTVRDWGRGFSEATAAGGLGIIGMRERADMIGGSLAVTTALGAGTEVAVRVPRPLADGGHMSLPA